MEEYARVATEEINRQWNKGINPAIYNGHEYLKPDAATRIEQIDKEVDNLKTEKRKLVEEQMEYAKDFEEKFEHWFLRCDHKEDFDYIPDRVANPLLRQWIDDCDLQRHQTIDVEDRMYEDLCLIFDKESREEGLKEGWLTEEKLTKYYKLAKEIMDNNIGTFTIDW